MAIQYAGDNMIQDWSIRTYSPYDSEECVALNLEAARLNARHYCTGAQSLAERNRQPGFDPESDRLLLAGSDNTLAGYVEVKAELSIGRSVLWPLVHPEWTGDGPVVRLLESACQRATEQGALVAHLNVPEDDRWMDSVAVSAGFKPVKRFLELRLKVGLLEDSILNQEEGQAFGRLEPGEESDLVGLQNRCFAGQWGYNLNSLEHVVYRLGLSDCRHEGVRIAWTCDRPVAYCWTTAEAASAVGRIYMVGVIPEHRGTDLGRQALLAGLSHLAGRGVRMVELTVDEDNLPALRLYESLGFRRYAAGLWYEKALSSRDAVSR